MGNNGLMEKSNNWLHYTAIGVTWIIVFSLSVSAVWDSSGQHAQRLPEAVTLQLLILVLMLLITSRRVSRSKLQLGKVLFVTMLATILLLAWRVPVSFLFIYTIMWITVAPYYFSNRTSIAWLLVAVVAWYVVMKVAWKDPNSVVDVLLIGTFHFFALISSIATRTAVEANERSQEFNRELKATQQLLAAASKQSERTRIARNLHDLLGHHLTALTINLQVAERLTEGEAKEKVEQCHALSKLLLNDVRDAVTTLREESSVDFAETLQLIVENVPGLNVQLEIDPALKIDDVNVVQAILRCVQEAITNTLKHSGAENSWIRVWREGDQLRLSIRDDGRVPPKILRGNGLKGMQERIERLNGELAVETMQNLRINIQIPIAG